MNHIERLTFFLYLDGCRYDYISQENTPFLYQLSKDGFFSRVKTVPGFTQEATMMTGKEPNETGYFTWYRYAPDRSPFIWVRPLGFLKHMRKLRIYYAIKVAIREITQLITGKEYPDPGFIPLDILPLFENVSATLPNHLPNLSSLCRLSKRSCFEQTSTRGFMRSKRCSELFRPVIKSIGSSRPYDLYLVHVGELDGLGHRYGPHPELFQDSLREIDAWVHGTFGSATKRKLALNLIIVSDHGMFDVKDTVDIERKLELIPLKVPEDYLYFLDSTIARFWFFNAKAKRLVEEILSTVPNGHILSQQEKEKLKIDFKLDNFYGELLFWVDKGYMIFPNFFQSITQDKTSGMHGYIDDEDGALIIHSSAGILRDVSNMYGKDVVPLSKVFEITRTVGGF